MRMTLLAAMASAGLLVACGGGSGGDSTTDGGSPGTPPVSTSATVALSGTAAKGLMAGADVFVYAVKADGTLDTSTSLAPPTVTGADGKYSLSFTGTKDQPYVVVVKANANTTHLDEVTGQSQALPAGFTMRSLVVPSATGNVTTTASVTPFSEMAVAAAAKSTGGVTAANAAQAISTVTQLLGFNPTAVAATTVGAASGADEQKLAVMLTAVSQLANSGDLGCNTGSAGDKTKCVVEALAAATTKDSIKLGDNANDVSAKLSTAVTTVLNDDAVRAKVDASVLTAVVANLGCTTNCTAAAVGTNPGAPSATATAIAAAKLLFAEIKSDWSAMFSHGGATAVAGGALNQEAFKFKTAVTGVQIPAETMAKDLGAMLLGVDLYNDYKAGRATSPSRGRGDGSLVKGDGSVPDAQISPAGCTLYQDSANTVTATSPSNANFIGCSARYYATRTVSGATTNTTEWRHGFTLTPAADGSFDYASRARRRVNSCTGNTCTFTSNVALQVDAGGTAIAAFTGKLTPTLSAANGDITAFTLVGELPAAFESGGNTLVGYKHTIDVSGTQVVAGVGQVTSTLQGSLSAVDSAGTTTAKVTIKPGSTLGTSPAAFDANGDNVAPGSATAVSTGGGMLTSVVLDIVFGTPTAEFEGVLSLTDTTWDKSGTVSIPTRATLSGALRNLAGDVRTEFLKGVFSGTVTGYAAFDATQARTAANTFTVGASFVGTVTAAGRPTLEFSLGSTWTDADSAADLAGAHMTLQYRTLVGGVPRMVVALTADRNAQGTYDLQLTEAASNLSLRWSGEAATADLFVAGTTKIGTLVTGSGLLTFSDASFISLDVGL